MTQQWQYVSPSEAATDALGRLLADVLEPGDLVALSGELGAGKTRLVRAIAVGMGADPHTVGSPTFVLIREYVGRLPIYHLDPYRLRDPEEFLELGVEEILGGEGICLIEWADRVAEVLPEDVLWVEIIPAGEQTRRFHFSPGGPQADALLQRLRRRVES